MFFDTHCHLSAPALAPQLEAVTQRAADAGVGAALNIGDSLETSALAIEQARRELPIKIFAAAGIHPHNAQGWSKDAELRLRDLLAQPEVVALGEIGLDFFYDEAHPQHPGAPRAVQERAFEEQLALAAELNLPVVIHNRLADDSLLRIVQGMDGVRGVFHAFNSPIPTMRAVLAAGFSLGIGGMATFKKADEAREAAANCPLDAMILETDAPYLAPVPMRGKTNEPAFLAHTARFVSHLCMTPLDEVARVATRNACELFGVSLG